MPIDLLNMPAADAERLAYAEGFPGTAKLFARIADLQEALGKATAEIEQLRDALTVADYELQLERNHYGEVSW